MCASFGTDGSSHRVNTRSEAARGQNPPAESDADESVTPSGWTTGGNNAHVSGVPVLQEARPHKALRATGTRALATAAAQPGWKAELGAVRTDWTRDEVAEVFNTPLLDLMFAAASVHRQNHDPRQVQKCTLLSIKTGGCPEDCGYCSQSSKHSKDTGMKAEKLVDLDYVYHEALKARDGGSTRFCMGAAWRGPSQVGERQFGRVLDMVTKIRALGMEVCTTLGMLTPEQAVLLRSAGLTAYNHNLDTSPEYYGKITTTRRYSDRLNTLSAVRDAGISVCSGGIIGLGEEDVDRVGLLHTLATLPEHPESVPVNALVAVKGTPLEGQTPPTGLEMVRCVATARILMPRSMVRLSAGRLNLSDAEQAMCFFAGANSVFSGEKLLTTPNNEEDQDTRMMQTLGLYGRPPFIGYNAGGETSSHATFAADTAVANQQTSMQNQAA